MPRGPLKLAALALFVAIACNDEPPLRERALGSVRLSTGSPSFFVGPEFELTEREFEPRSSGEAGGEIACNGAGTCLVVWQVSGDVFGARVTSNGTLLDPGGIPIGVAFNDQATPTVDYDGTSWFVVWTDERNTTSSSLLKDIYGARVDASGRVLDPNGIRLTQTPVAWLDVALSHDGTNWFAAWSDHRSDTSDLYGTRVSRNGTVLDPNGIAISTAARQQQEPRLAYDGNQYLVVWNDQRNEAENFDVYAARVTSSGSLLDPNGIAIATGTRREIDPRVSSDGANWLVTWVDSRTALQPEIFATRVTSGGTVLDSAGIQLTTTRRGKANGSIVHDGQNWFAVFSEDVTPSDRDIFGVRVNPQGSPLDARPIPLVTASGTQGVNSVAYEQSAVFVVWSGNGPGDKQPNARRVSTSGVVGFDVLLAVRPSRQNFPAVARGHSGWLTAWAEQRPAPRVQAARVSDTGAVLDPCGIRLRDVYGPPVVTFDGTNWLVAWSETSGIRGARIDENGGIEDAGGSFAISGLPSNAYAASMAAAAHSESGGTSLVVWEEVHDDPNSTTDPVTYAIRGARVSSSGGVLDPSGILITSTGEAHHPVVSSNGTDWLVTWSDRYRTIYGARVSGAGALLDGAAVAISATGAFGDYPDVAYDGANWFVSWESYGGSSADSDILAARMSGSGIVLAPGIFPISTEAYRQERVTLARYGDGILSAWRDRRKAHSEYDLYATLVNGAGTVESPLGFPLAENPGDKRVPAIDVGPAGKALLVYQRVVGATERIDARLLHPVCADRSDTDGDGVPACADECPAVGAATGNGCPRAACGGAGGAGGMAGGSGAGGGGLGGAAGGGAGGSTGGMSGASGASGTSGATGNGGSSGTAGTGGRSGASGDGGASGAEGGGDTSGGGGEAGDSSAGAGVGGGGAHDGGAGASGEEDGSGAGHEPDASGCGCRITASPSRSPASGLLALVGLSFFVRRSPSRRRQTATAT